MKAMRQIITALMLMICVGAYATSPSITGFSPSNGSIGTVVTITGTNLSSPVAFTIGGVAAIVVSNTDTTLVGMVMPGAVTGIVSVTTLGGTATSSINFTITSTLSPGQQQGTMLSGTGASAAVQGYSVALSADGNTAIEGGPYDDNSVGAAWIFKRSGGVWAQQGPKLVGTGAVDYGGSTSLNQGWSVALSADGNTAIVGAPFDSVFTGAVWIYTRTDTTWTQQGPKLVDTEAIVSPENQGWSVALSADGNTAVVGIFAYDTIGAACIYVRSAGVWTTQGHLLIGAGAIGHPSQGVSVAISADGNTVIVGGNRDNGNVGAAWIYTRSGSNWTQQGNKLVGTGSAGGSYQGTSVALSADGNMALVGGPCDSGNIGAVWIYKRSGNVWTQQGTKLVGTGAAGNSGQGRSVALSADGSIAIVGGNTDGLNGATWVFTRSGTTWTQWGSKLVGSQPPSIIGPDNQGWSVALSADGTTAMVGGNLTNSPTATDTGAVWVFVPCNTCGADSVVWPGDADANHVVDNTDLLTIGLAYDSTGPVRAVQGTVWQADQATNWNDSFTVYAPAVNFKYADCNGDGIIDANDTMAIMTNFSLTHAKTGPMLTPWRNGIPAIKAVVSPDTAYTGDTLTVTFVLGDTNTTVNNLYGLAFRYNFDPLVVDSTFPTSMSILPTSWIGTPSQKISINKIFSTTGQIQAAVTRINHTGVSGHGAIATASFKITTDNISGKNYSYYTNKWSITDVIAIDQYGDPIPLNAGADSSTVGFIPTGIHEVTTETLHIQPNPAHDRVLISAGNIIREITLSNIMGQQVMDNNNANSRSVSIDVSELESGVYVVQVKTNKGTGIAKLVIEK